MATPQTQLPIYRLMDLFSGAPLPAGPIGVCGRVLALSPEELVLDDGTRTAAFPLDPAAPPPAARPGDHVAVVLSQAAAGASPSGVHVLYRHPGDFPRPDGDFYRLRRDGGQRLQSLRRRGALLGEIRRFFTDRDFLEIEAPLLVPSPGLELHLQAFSVTAAEASSGPARYLITSPEYQLKRLLCAGIGRVYSLGKVFRSGEAGGHHNPEFTLLEWYRPYAGWESVARDVEELCAQVATAATGSPALVYQGQAVDLTPPWQRMTVRAAVEQYAGIRLEGDETTETLAERIRERGLRLPSPGAPARWDDLFFSVFLDHVEPRLGRGAEGPARPVVLYDWPAPLCALARRKPGQEQVVERFEAYVCGVELCNGFGELCDAAEQRRRFEHDLQERRERGLPLYPVDERFLLALEEGLPPSGGVALGVDRLMMLALDAAHIAQVLPFTTAEL